MTQKTNYKLPLAITNAFARLKPDPKTEKTEAVQSTCEAAAHNIILLSKIPTKHKVSRGYFKDEAATQKELTQLFNLFSQFSRTLAAQIPSLNSDAVSAIGGTQSLQDLSSTVLGMGTRLEHILQVIKASEEKKHLKSGAQSNPSDKKKALRSGAPSNLRVQMIAQTAASFYERITGKRPTVTKNNYSDPPTLGGAYYLLLEDIFGILKIEASVEHYASEASRNRRLLSRQSSKTG